MFEFDAGKLIIIGIVALIVIGPKELPRVMRHVGEAMAKMRRMAAEFRGQLLDAMRESEIDDIKAGIEKLAENTKPDFGDEPVAQIKAELTQALAATEKPASLPAESATVLAATQKRDFALNPSAHPNSSEMAGASVVESGKAPAASAVTTNAASAVDAEMRALADALTAEIGETEPVSAVGESAKARSDR
jgi:sec-independent protein translocase protein TatB